MAQMMSYVQQKKKVDGKYNPDTFRVISEDAVCEHPKYQLEPYRSSFEPSSPTLTSTQWNNNNATDAENLPFVQKKSTKVLPQLLIDYRANNPHSQSCGFLDKNVRFLNEPICNVFTANVKNEERYWWPARSNPGELQIPPFTESTHYRNDYNYRHGEQPAGAGRHTANVNRETALGTIPVNYLRKRDGTQRLCKEGLSYEHMYNSRASPNYPNRGKRHGVFVWKEMDPISQRKFIEYYERLEQEDKKAMENRQEKPLSNEDGIRVIRSTNHKCTSGQSSTKCK